MHGYEDSYELEHVVSQGWDVLDVITYDACSKKPEYNRQWQGNNISNSLREVEKEKEVSNETAC